MSKEIILRILYFQKIYTYITTWLSCPLSAYWASLCYSSFTIIMSSTLLGSISSICWSVAVWICVNSASRTLTELRHIVMSPLARCWQTMFSQTLFCTERHSQKGTGFVSSAPLMLLNCILGNYIKKWISETSPVSPVSIMCLQGVQLTACVRISAIIRFFLRVLLPLEGTNAPYYISSLSRWVLICLTWAS